MDWFRFKLRLRAILRGKRRAIRGRTDARRLIGLISISLIVIIGIVFFKDGIELWKKAEEPLPIEKDVIDEKTKPVMEIEKAEHEPKKIVIEDLSNSHRHLLLETKLQRINEPVAFRGEIMYSGGGGGNIEDQEVLTQLAIYDIEGQSEDIIADSGIKFGEIYEGRFNEKWAIWLDTNHLGENIIYAMNRNTGDITEIDSCEHNKPKLKLWGDDLVWVKQGDIESDSLYICDLTKGEVVALEVFDSPTYGTCPPAIWEDTLIWSSAGENGNSIIKRLSLQSDDGSMLDDLVEEHIDPKGFAIYPATNGRAIAWIDNLNPKEATLKLTLDGENIIDVDEGIGRFFGVGDNFIGYTKGDDVMVYFWEEEKYAHINPKDVAGRLTSSESVKGQYILWYSNAPNESKDIVNISVIE